MGKATRWFKSLLGMKKEKDKEFSSNLSDHQRDNKKRWSFGKSVRDSVCVGHFPPETNFNNPADTEETETETTATTTNTNATSTWVKSSSSYYSEETENEQNKHAIAVAAATAAAADAAVAAAHAAVAVVRLTSHGRGTLFNGATEKWAAIKIQTIFRGYLAKKALRALKGLVKLQALVRGYLVRKQADATLHSMQALIRAQFTIRSQKARYQLNQEQQRAYPPEFRPRRSTERYDDARSEHSAAIHHSRRLSASLEAAINTFEETPKIVEIDTCRPKSSRSRRTPNNSISDYGEDPNYPARMDSPRLQACPKPARMSIPDCRNFQEFDWTLAADECRFSTAQSTPRFVNSCNAPVTPSKSVCTERLFRPYSNFPNYMANTQSFKAKVRSYSAPKQRPETGSRKRLSLSEIAESRASLSGVRMQRSCSQAQEAISFKNAVMGKLDRSSEFGVSDIEREYIQRRW